MYERKSIFHFTKTVFEKRILVFWSAPYATWGEICGFPHPDRAKKPQLSTLNVKYGVCVFLVSSVQHNQLLHRGGPSVVLLDEGITTGWKQHVLPTNTTGLDVLPESARAYLPIILSRKSTNTVSSLSEPGSRDYVWLIPQKNSNKYKDIV